MFVYFKEQKDKITGVISDYIQKQKNSILIDKEWSHDTFNRIQTFSSQGKMLRGGLVALSYSLFNDIVPQAAYELGAVMELFQTCFLIQDDIMDNDLLRRGLPTIHSQYKKLAAEKALDDKIDALLIHLDVAIPKKIPITYLNGEKLDE